MWTTGKDFLFLLHSGEEIWLQTRCFDHTVVHLIEAPAEKHLIGELSWEDVPQTVKRYLFHILYPSGSRCEENIFVLGDKAGQEINEKEIWASEHKIFSFEGTLLLMEKIGRWDSSKFIRSVSHWVGTGYKTYYYRLSAGGKTYEAWFEVTGPDTFLSGCKEIDLKAEKAAKREYYNKVKSLADEAGVPWAIASLLKDKDGDRKKNIAALMEARQIHFSKLDRDTVHELTCGIDRRLAAISDLLMRSELFALNGQVKSRRLADYLVGRIH